MALWMLFVVLSAVVAILGLVVWRLARDRRSMRADTTRLAKAVTKVLVARDASAQYHAITWLRREFLWLDNRWPAMASEVRKRPRLKTPSEGSGGGEHA